MSNNEFIVSDSLAVKYRPTKLEEVIGNTQAKAIIQGMLNNHRFPKSLLIHGSHGKGKTTLARLIARYLNCETQNACGTCSSCVLGLNNPDVIELNMADTRKIDDVRGLIEKSKFSPRFKHRVFILDELHQCLTSDSLILMSDGSVKRIADINTYDSVVTANEHYLFHKNSLRLEPKLVVSTFATTRNEIVTVNFTNNHSVTCTGDHPFYSLNQNNFADAKHLVTTEAIGELESRDLVVSSVTRHSNDSRLVYDLTIADNHNFFVQVGDCYALVHNCTPEAKEAMLKPLEEPPPSTMWILCTTNPEKLSPTILSRCQQIKVEAPTFKELGQFLIRVSKQEGQKVLKEDLPVIKHIAELSMGHTRNALQLLENFLAIKSSGSEVDADELMHSLSASIDDNLDELAAKLLSYILTGKGQEAVKLLFVTNRDSSMMSILLKLKYLIDLVLTNWAGATKYSSPAHKHFLKLMGKESLNVNHMIMVMNTLVQAEITIKTVSALDERTYFSAVILNDMVKILQGE